MRPMLTILMLALCISASSQNAYPKGYFRNPLDIPISLSGNFGELRPNHYHMGIDLKTAQRENLSVHAAAEGYISRIKIEPGGFGRAIYITHPNGYTTLYAHLNNFAAAIDAYVKQQQYVQESWRVQLDISPGKFVVKQGDFIAFSGNTGGSQAPHLHFEIRRTVDDVNVNPMLFGFPIADNIKPRILRLAVYDRTLSVYEQSPKLFPLKSVSPSAYTTVPGILAVGAPLISLAITSYDTHNGSSNLNGIFEASLTVNGKKEESFRMDNISYHGTRYINAHIDYRYKTLGGSYLQHLSELPGYLNSIYTNGSEHGVLDISDGDIYDIDIEVADAAGNTSSLKTRIQYQVNKLVPAKAPGKMFYPLMLDGYESDNCEFYIGERCLYDSVHLNYSSYTSGDPDVMSDVQVIGASYIPLQDSFTIGIKPLTTIPEEDKKFTVMQWFNGQKQSVQKVVWQQDWAYARFRDLGKFQLVEDSDPPVIVPLGFANGSVLTRESKIVFNVKDNLKVVKKVRAELDGKWLRFTNDKNGRFIYAIDEKFLPGRHVLKIWAEDEAGNVTLNTYTISR